MNEHLERAKQCLATAIRLAKDGNPSLAHLAEARDELVAAQLEYQQISAVLQLLPSKVVMQ